MKETKKKNYFVGIDAGTNSVGYAVTDNSAKYNILKHAGEPLIGVHLFDSAETGAKRRTFRTARRRLNRKKQRIKLLQELFSEEIARVDETFFHRAEEGSLIEKGAENKFTLYNNDKNKYKEYNKDFPTIHHLIVDLMLNPAKHDVRLVYTACAWLLGHRGHFLSEISENNTETLIDFSEVYSSLISYFEDTSDADCVIPFKIKSTAELEDALKQKLKVTDKTNVLSACLYGSEKPPKKAGEVSGFPFSVEGIIKLLAGGTVSMKGLFGKDEYKDYGSFTLNSGDEEYAQKFAELGDDAELLLRLKAVYDWATLCTILKSAEHGYISESKTKTYDQHKKDLKFLKHLIRTYLPEKYDEMFRSPLTPSNYVSHSDNLSSVKHRPGDYKKSKKEDYCKYIKDLIENISVKPEDKDQFEDCIKRLETSDFMPKQVDSDNRVIPYQLYYAELKKILENASKYLPFLNCVDETGLSVKDKVLSIMKFRVPYFVGPLNESSKFAWIKRKADGRILPWNFDEKVDIEACEREFINRMTNTCTYYAGADVLPKNSLINQKFEVLNEINVIQINGKRLPVEVKQRIYSEIFEKKKKITVKMIKDFLVSKCGYDENEAEILSGLDEKIKSSLSSYQAFSRLLSNGTLTEDEVEHIILQKTCIQSNVRFANWLKKEYSQLSDEDIRRLSTLSMKDFGRLSKEFLYELIGNDTTNENSEGTILDFMWRENVNLMELLSSKYTFSSELKKISVQYYGNRKMSIDDRLDEFYVSPTVRRQISRALSVVKEIIKTQGGDPEKIFVELSRGEDALQKGKKTSSRRQKIESILSKKDLQKDSDVVRMKKDLALLGEDADNKLQKDKLYLYFMQLGRCLYTGEEISLTDAMADGQGLYNKDHIIPQALRKDDSVINNLVLVKSQVNGNKNDEYPVKHQIQKTMGEYWKKLLGFGFMTNEKYTRLQRTLPISEEENAAFVNRQLVETRQATKALCTILREDYPDTEIVCVKAGLVSEFRQIIKIPKCRSLNDLHHAKDAYLNVVCGNVYYETTTKAWQSNAHQVAAIKTESLFAKDKARKTGTHVYWDGAHSFDAVVRTVSRNNIRTSFFPFCRKGKIFDTNPVKAAQGLVPLKKGLDPEIYGGYSSPAITYFWLVTYTSDSGHDTRLLPVELMREHEVSQNIDTATKYAIDRIFQLTNKTAKDVVFPLGLRKIKIGTIFSFDGLKYTISGVSGNTVIMSMFEDFKTDCKTEAYIKALESFKRKTEQNSAISYDPTHSVLTAEKNLRIYDLFIEKYTNGLFAKRKNSPLETLISGREEFTKLSMKEQASVLLTVLFSFGKHASGGINLKPIGGKKNAAVTRFNASVELWKKSYNSVSIINESVTGAYKDTVVLF